MDKKSHGCETPNKESTNSAQTDDPKEILKNFRKFHKKTNWIH